MTDIRSAKVLVLKGALLAVLGCLASAVLLLEHPSVKVGMLLTIAVWAFFRAYYFAFYVIEHYIDHSYKFAGLWSVVRYYWNGRRASGPPTPPAERVDGSGAADR
jgi:hypothetical protein